MVAASLIVLAACGDSGSASRDVTSVETTLGEVSPSPETTIGSMVDTADPDQVPELDEGLDGDPVDLSDLSELVSSAPIIVRATIPSEPDEVSSIEGGPVGIGFASVALRGLSLGEVLKNDPNEYQVDVTPRLSTEPGAHQLGMTATDDSEAIADLGRSHSLDVLLFLGGIGDPDDGVLAPNGGLHGVFVIRDERLEPTARNAAFAADISFEEARRQIDAMIEQHANRTVLENPPLELERQARDMPSPVVPESWVLRQAGPTTFDFEASEAPDTVIAAVCATDELTGRNVTDVCDIRDAVVTEVAGVERVSIDVPILAGGTARLGNAEVLECARVRCWLVVASDSDLAQRIAVPINR